jgi:hypothetical protein
MPQIARIFPAICGVFGHSYLLAVNQLWPVWPWPVWPRFSPAAAGQSFLPQPCEPFRASSVLPYHHKQEKNLVATWNLLGGKPMAGVWKTRVLAWVVAFAVPIMVGCGRTEVEGVKGGG